jgi:hypothetical protein
MIPCSAHRLEGSKSPVNGHAVMVPGGLAFVMLDVSAPAGKCSEAV